MGERNTKLVLCVFLITMVIIVVEPLDWNLRHVSTSWARLNVMKTRNMYQCERLCLRFQPCLSVSYSTTSRRCSLYMEELADNDINSSRQHIVADVNKSNMPPDVCSPRCPTGSTCVSSNAELNCLVVPIARDCSEVMEADNAAPDGVYIIRPEGSNLLKVYCDMTDDGGGWTVLQRRTDGSEIFFRDWVDYRDGFGDVSNEFWLGNENIFHFTNQKNYHLKIDLEDFEQQTVYASYSSFRIESERDMYRLRISSYSGDAGDSLGRHTDDAFSNRDVDNDTHDTLNCAARFLGAWWYHSCHSSNLNGQYNNTDYAKGVVWNSFRGYYYSLKFSQMKIRA